MDETLERITVNLVPRSSKALHETMELTGDNKTDIFNNAIRLHALVEKVKAAGGEIYLREPGEEMTKLAWT